MPRERWLNLVPGMVALSGLLLLYGETASDMVAIWIRSGTFQHGFLVLPISAWLIWRDRDRLAGVRLAPMPWLLVPMLVVALIWLLGELVSVAAASQLALVSLLVLAVPTLFGWQLTRAILFPLLFLYFAVPFGEFLVPMLQAWTADVTVFALRATGIPVYREGMQFLLPTGSWSVIEACSGFRYMVALFMVGTLYAYLNFQSNRKRFMFAVFALLISLPANWIRAYSIVMIGHLTGSPMILGVEHTTYGWFLFGFIVMLVFWGAARWADVPAARAGEPATRPHMVFQGPTGTIWAMALTLLLLFSATRAVSHRLALASSVPAPSVRIDAGGSTWAMVEPVPGLRWIPGIVNPEQTGHFAFSDGGPEVHVWVGYYRQQDDRRKLATSVHRLVAEDNDKWRTLATGRRTPGGGLPQADTFLVTPGASVGLQESERDRVWKTYWTDGQWTASPARVKLLQAYNRLLGRGSDGAVVLFVTRSNDGADERLEAFLHAQGAALQASLEAMNDNR